MILQRCFFFIAVWMMSAWAAYPAMAQHTLTLNVSGNVLDDPYSPPSPPSACTPNIQQELRPGSYNTANAVTLPNVDVSDLGYAGATWGNVTLQFRASGCTGYVDYMWVHFTSSNVDGNGRIIPNNSSQLRFEIRNNDVNGSLVRVGGSAGSSPNANQGTAVSFSGSHPANSSRTANKYYGIRYYAQMAVTSTGNYSATVTANFKYY